MINLKFSVGYWVYGPMSDRFLSSGYKENLNFEKRLEQIAKTPGLSGVEIPFGQLLKTDDIEKIKQKIENFGFSISSLGANVTSDPKWALGSLSSPDKKIRGEAIEIIKNVIDAAYYLNIDTVNLWMGQDGFDYPFEVDYSLIWKYLVDGLSKCASYQPEIKLSIEYKKMEPRVHLITNSVAKALLLVKEVDKPNLGVTLDFGHALLGGENPSESALLLSKFKKLFHLHLNDNYGDWDWDMAVGLNNWWLLIEFCYWLIELNYNGWLVLDLFPYRNKAEKICATSIKSFKRAWTIAKSLDRALVKESFKKHSSLEVFNHLLKYKA